MGQNPALGAPAGWGLLYRQKMVQEGTRRSVEYKVLDEQAMMAYLDSIKQAHEEALR